MCFILYVLIKHLIFKVDICDAWRVLYLLLWLVLAVGKIVHRELLKLHDILSERSCLVTEDVMHHAQLLVKIGALTSCTQPRILIRHIDVNPDEVSLRHIDHFQGNQQRNRHKVHQSNEPNASLQGNLL